MEKKPDLSGSMLHLIASLVTTYQMEVEDWDLGPMTKKNWRKINHQVIEHNESLKFLCIGLKAAYESIKINLKEKDRDISSLQSQNERLLSALKGDKFAQGFLCAVVALITMNGEVDTRTRELFQSGGYKLQDLEKLGIDEHDIEVLRKHKSELQSN